MGGECIVDVEMKSRKFVCKECSVGAFDAKTSNIHLQEKNSVSVQQDEANDGTITSILTSDKRSGVLKMTVTALRSVAKAQVCLTNHPILHGVEQALTE